MLVLLATHLITSWPMWNFSFHPGFIRLLSRASDGLLKTNNVGVRLMLSAATANKSTITWIGINHCWWTKLLPVVAFIAFAKSRVSFVLNASDVCMSGKGNIVEPWKRECFNLPVQRVTCWRQ